MEHYITLITSAESPVLVVIISFILVFLFIKEIYAAIQWVIARLDGYHNIKDKQENKEEDVEERLKKLESHDYAHWNKLNEMSEEIKEIISMIKCVQETQAKTTIDTYKGSIFRIYHDAMRNKFISQTELDRFIEICKIYKEAGGDGVVDEKIYPEILKLPIKAED